MDEKKRIDLILDAAKERLKQEVGLLLGTELTISASQSKIVSKEEFIEDLRGKQIFAKVDIAGELQGLAGIVVGIKTAIYLGGTLIMLPQNELDKFAEQEEYSEELDDSYGEIANIVAGAYTKTFEEMYHKDFRFIRKELDQLISTKVDISSEEPLPDTSYYRVSHNLVLAGNDLGELSFLLPAALFGLVTTEQKTHNEEVEPILADDREQEYDAEEGLPQEPLQKSEAVFEPDTSAEETLAGGRKNSKQHPDSGGAARQLDKRRRRIDKVLDECRHRVQSEVSALLGSEIVLNALENKVIDKETFFLEEVSGKQVLANMDVIAETKGKGFFVIGLQDAIYTGGLLIMLPESELEKMVAEENFSEDIADAYGEIANIVSGGYTGVFDEQYIEKLHFIRKEVFSIVPLKVASEEDVPDLPYYLSSMTINVAGVQRGKVHMLIPADLLGLDGLGQEPVSEAVVPPETPEPQVKAEPPQPKSSVASAPHTQEVPSQSADILVVSDDAQVAKLLGEEAAAKGLSVRYVSLSDDVRAAVTPEVKAIYLVMQEISEQAFGMAITLRGVSSLPLVAAGPAWTRRKVIRAVKYGVSDILLTPATASDVSENLDKNIQRKAA